jgi:F-type H+-transporting ATPase subunit delta
MIVAFGEILARHRGEVTAEVTSAQPLSQTQLDAIQAALAEATGARVALSAELDPDIIGGLVVKIGSRMVDFSLRTKLQRLELAMKGAA